MTVRDHSGGKDGQADKMKVTRGKKSPKAVNLPIVFTEQRGRYRQIDGVAEPALFCLGDRTQSMEWVASGPGLRLL